MALFQSCARVLRVEESWIHLDYELSIIVVVLISFCCVPMVPGVYLCACHLFGARSVPTRFPNVSQLVHEQKFFVSPYLRSWVDNNKCVSN